MIVRLSTIPARLTRMVDWETGLVDSNRTLTGNIKKRDRPLSASVCADKKRDLEEKLNNSNYATEQGPGLPETEDIEW